MSRKHSSLKFILGAVLFILFLGRKLKSRRACSNSCSPQKPPRSQEPTSGPLTRSVSELLARIAKSTGENSPSSQTDHLEQSPSFCGDYAEPEIPSSALLSTNYDDEENPAYTLATDYDQLEEPRLPRFMWGA